MKAMLKKTVLPAFDWPTGTFARMLMNFSDVCEMTESSQVLNFSIPCLMIK